MSQIASVRVAPLIINESDALKQELTDLEKYASNITIVAAENDSHKPCNESDTLSLVSWNIISSEKSKLSEAKIRDDSPSFLFHREIIMQEGAVILHATQTGEAPPACKPDDFVRAFLFGTSSIVKDRHSLRSVLVMDDKTQGWVGIPHGGIAMGAMADLAFAFTREADGSFGPYPFSIDYRMGGASARLGDSLQIELTATEDGVRGVMVKNPGAAPYLSATFCFAHADPSQSEIFRSYLPTRIGDEEKRMVPLPSYRNCFVCGIARREPGLARRFYVLDVLNQQKIVTSPIGCAGDSGDAFYRFQRYGRLHPLPLLALLDEIIGWGGFLLTASGGVTVKASYTFYRDIQVGERLWVFGRGEKVRGNAASRLLFWASGGAAAVRSDGVLEPVVVASGQYLCVGALTEQMRRELLPADLTRRAFQLAGASA
jgi:hypothetical protein